MENVAATSDDNFLGDLLKASDHILYRIDLVRGATTTSARSRLTFLA